MFAKAKGPKLNPSTTLNRALKKIAERVHSKPLKREEIDLRSSFKTYSMVGSAKNFLANRRETNYEDTKLCVLLETVMN